MDSTGEWHKVNIVGIEDLADAVLGAGLEATQLTCGQMSGSLVFSNYRDVIYSSGLIRGRVALQGPLSENLITIGLGVRLGCGSQHWLNEVSTCDVGVFHPGDEHDSIYTDNSLYASVSLSEESLNSIAANLDLVLDKKQLGGTGVHCRRFDVRETSILCKEIERVHFGLPTQFTSMNLQQYFLESLIVHCARHPRQVCALRKPEGLAAIVSKAREYIDEHLKEPISVDAVALACNSSRRTLFRAFSSILGESPRAYIERRRLHHIRWELNRNRDDPCTVALAANRWGISELGRMAGRYKEVFAELPSQTLARQQLAQTA